MRASMSKSSRTTLRITMRKSMKSTKWTARRKSKKLLRTVARKNTFQKQVKVLKLSLESFSKIEKRQLF